MEEYKPFGTGLIIGRFQHFHIGHEMLVDTSLRLCDKLLIFVGSSQESGTLRNPFTVDMRCKIIQEIYGDDVIVAPLPDMTNENDINYDWGRYLLSGAKAILGKLPDIMIYGNDESRSGWFDKEDIKDIAELIVPRSKLEISATKMREYIVSGNKEEWQKYSNVKVYKYYDKLREELLKLRKEDDYGDK